MKVAFVVPRLSPTRGLERAVAALTTALAADGRWQVETWALRGPVVGGAADPGTRVLVADTTGADPEDLGPESRPSRLPGGFDAPALTASTDAALAHALSSERRPDVVVTTTPWLLAGVTMAADLTLPVVHLERLAHAGQRTLDQLQSFGPRASMVVTTSPLLAARPGSIFGTTPPPTVSVPDALGDGFLPQSAGTERVVLAAGGMFKGGGHHDLLRSFALVADELPDWRLRLLGAGPAATALAARTRQLGLWDRVEMPGSTQDMSAEWARAGVAATPSSLGVPYAAAEAMAAGLAVAAIDSAHGPRHLLEDESDGLLVPRKPVEAMADALLRLTGDDTLRRRLGEAAEHRSRGWRAERLVPIWLEVLQEAASGGRRPLAASIPSLFPDTRPSTPAVGKKTIAEPPTDPLAHTLHTVAAAAAASGGPWFAGPLHTHDAPYVAVPHEGRDRFLEALATSDDGTVHVLPDGDQGDDPAEGEAPTTAVRAQLLADAHGDLASTIPWLRRGRTTSVRLGPPQLADGRATPQRHQGLVHVEFWHRSGDVLVAPSTRNPLGERVPTSTPVAEIEIAGAHLPVPAEIADPPVTAVDFPIDIVYTWVDGDDPQWSARREERYGAYPEASLLDTVSGQARFRSRDELLYSLRSVADFAPWVRTIHLVLDQDPPTWLDVGHPRIRVVHHREILPADTRPTFNSHAIETALHRIPGLAEHYIYMNDDVFLGRPARREQYFDSSGRFAAFWSDRPIGVTDDEATPSVRAGANNRDLVRERFGRTVRFSLLHTPHPSTISAVRQVEELFPEAIARTAASPFRSPTDVSVASSLVQEVGVLTGRAYPGSVGSAFVSLTDVAIRDQLRRLLVRRDVDTFCLADHHRWAIREDRVDAIVRRFLERYFPVPASWELPSGSRTGAVADDPVSPG